MRIKELIEHLQVQLEQYGDLNVLLQVHVEGGCWNELAGRRFPEKKCPCVGSNRGFWFSEETCMDVLYLVDEEGLE